MLFQGGFHRAEGKLGDQPVLFQLHIDAPKVSVKSHWIKGLVLKTVVGISQHLGVKTLREKKRSWLLKCNQPATVAAGRGKVAQRPFRRDALRARGR